MLKELQQEEFNSIRPGDLVRRSRMMTEKNFVLNPETNVVTNMSIIKLLAKEPSKRDVYLKIGRLTEGFSIFTEFAS